MNNQQITIDCSNKQSVINNKRVANDWVPNQVWDDLVGKAESAFAHKGGLLFIDYYLLPSAGGKAC